MFFEVLPHFLLGCGFFYDVKLIYIDDGSILIVKLQIFLNAIHQDGFFRTT
jgi:hypothetical protein